MEINIICSVLLIFVVTIGTILWNRSIRKRVKKNREEMNSLLNRYDKNVIASRTDLDGKITYVSDAFCNISGYSRDYLMGKPHSLVRHQDTDSRVFQELWSTIQRGDIWRG